MSRLRHAGDVLVVVSALIVELIVWSTDQTLRQGVSLHRALIPALTIAVYALLLLRWRYPFRIFWVQWAFAFVCLLAPGFEPFAGVFIALHAVASRLPSRLALTALASILVPFTVQSYMSVGRLQAYPTIGSFLQLMGLWTVLGFAVYGVGRLSYNSARRALRLRDLQLAEADEAIQAERLRLARELHDIVAHSVTVMVMQAAGAQAVLGPGAERVRGSLGVIETAGVQAMAELHRLLGLLRSVDPASDATEDDSRPTLADMTSLVELSRASGQRVEFSSQGESGPLDPSVELAAYRIVQESLTNVAKHAGETATAAVRLVWRSDALALTVSNTISGNTISDHRTGAVRAVLSSGHGLPGLRERVNLVGGTLVAGPVPGGFEVRAELPRTGSTLTSAMVDRADHR